MDKSMFEVIRVRARYRIRKAAGSYWLLDMEQSGKYYKEPIELNESGARIWELASQGWDISKMAQYLAEEYEVEPESVKEDIQQFLAGLEQAGIITE